MTLLELSTKNAEQLGKYEATLEILKMRMEIELEYSENKEMNKFLTNQIEYIDRQLAKGV